MYQQSQESDNLKCQNIVISPFYLDSNEINNTPHNVIRI